MTVQISYAGEAVSNPYSLRLENNSAAPYTLYAFQTLPDQGTNIFSLVWFASPFIIVPGNRIHFQWILDYNGVWAATGALRPGITFDAGGEVDVDPAGANTVAFSMDPGPHLTPPVSGSPRGCLVITDESTVPAKEFSVAIGMSGASTFAVQAGPNLTHTFSPPSSPIYWIGAGTDIQVGDVLDGTSGNLTAKVTFPPNVYELSYALNPLNQWELQQG